MESGITGLWHRTVALIEREAENLYHAWRDQQTENHLYRQLIDARFHLFMPGTTCLSPAIWKTRRVSSRKV